MSTRRMAVTRKRVTALVAVVAATALLAACGSSGSSGSNGGGSGSAATSEELKSAQDLVKQWQGTMSAADFPKIDKLAKAPAVQGKTIYLVPLSDGIPVIHSIVLGVEAALDKVGAKYKVCDGGAGGQPNPTSWGNCLKTAQDQKADAVMTFFIDYQAVATAFDSLAKAGIPTLIAGVEEKGLTPTPGLIDFYDNTARLKDGYGKMAVSALAHGGKDTNILWLRLLDSTATTGSSDAGIAKFKEICKACGIQTADFTTANSQAQLAATVSAALVQHPDINLVLVPVDNFTPLAIQGIQQAGKTGKVQIVSGSGSLDALQRIKDGKQLATQSGPIQFEGWMFANGLMQLLAGQKVAKVTESVVRDFSSENVGSLDLTTAKAQTDDWYTTGQPYIDTFLTAWGIK